MTRKQLLKQIDLVIKQTWKNNIKKDYFSGYTLREDSLKSCMYYHLRRKLAKILTENNLRIYTEYYFPEVRCFADMVIVRVGKEQVSDLKESVKEILAVFELKATCGISNSVTDRIKADIYKFKDYIQRGKIDAQFYFCTIYEVECWSINWMDKRSTDNWANGYVTELNAGYIDEVMKFEVHSYNNMNKELDG